MIQLRKEEYVKVAGPLKQVGINHHFARSVIENSAAGKVFADDTENPKTFYISHPYGMGLLFGENGNPAFNAWLKTYALNLAHPKREHHEWMQAYPMYWDQTLQELLGDRLIRTPEQHAEHQKETVELYTRVNFKFNREKYLENRKTNIDSDIRVVRTDAEIYRNLNGSVVPRYFWNSEDDFIKNAVGFTVFYGNEIASTAFAAFVHDRELEIGIETVRSFGGKGLARLSCTALIDYCIENGYEPVWACRLTNTGSYLLAQKLGFEPVKEIPYYKLSK